MTTALERQVDGDHYKRMGEQPMAFSMRMRLDACQHTAIKYISRYMHKGKPLVDLEKALHCVDLQEQLTKQPPPDKSEHVPLMTEVQKYASKNGLGFTECRAIYFVLIRNYQTARKEIQRLIDQVNEMKGTLNDH